MKAYQTRWVQGRTKGTYRTKKFTQMHLNIHNSPKVEYACTLETDSSVDWPFGLYAEVIAITDRRQPNKNKPFAEKYLTK